LNEMLQCFGELLTQILKKALSFEKGPNLEFFTWVFFPP
jgi:hypothetical protein